MRRTAVVLVLVSLLQGCSGGEADSSQSAPDPGQIELWKLEVMLADRTSSSLVRASGPSSWSTAFAPDGSVIRPGVGEIRGREAIHEAFMEEIYSNSLADLRWSPERAEVSGSGNMGYTVGQYLAVGVDSAGVQIPTRGMYVRIWALQADGSWKVELEIRNPVADEGTSPDSTGGDQP